MYIAHEVTSSMSKLSRLMKIDSLNTIKHEQYLDYYELHEPIMVPDAG